MELLELLIRSVGSILILFILTKLMGYRQISQLSFYDYIIGISVGSISADMATGLDTDWWHTAIPLGIYAFSSLLMSWWTIKSIKVRKFLTGVPVVLLQNGKLIQENMKKVHYDLDDFLAECRSSGYFNLEDLQYAVMEHTGKISFLPYPQKRPCCPEDFQMTPEQEGLVANLIVDGTIMKRHLRRIGRDENWLLSQLKSQNISSPEQVLLATCDCQGQFHAYLKNHGVEPMDVLD